MAAQINQIDPQRLFEAADQVLISSRQCQARNISVSDVDDLIHAGYSGDKLGQFSYYEMSEAFSFLVRMGFISLCSKPGR